MAYRHVISALFALLCFSAKANVPYIAFTAIVEHPALDDVRKGAIEELKIKGYEGNKIKITFDSAQGQPVNAAQIASKLVGAKPDVIVAISTPSAQALASATKDIPIVFSAVTDPIAAKLIKTYEKPGSNITGVTDMAPVAAQIDLGLKIIPNAKKIGVIYNPGETNSVALIAVLKKVVKEKNLTLIESAANRTGDLSTAAERLVGKVDFVYLPTDNVIASGLESAVGIMSDNKIMTIGDAAYVERGVTIGSGFNYYELGKITGEMIADILNGAKPGNMAVRSSNNIDVMINRKESIKLKIKIPDGIAKNVKYTN